MGNRLKIWAGGQNCRSKEAVPPASSRDPPICARITALDPPSTPFWRSRASGPGLMPTASMRPWPPVSLALPWPVPLAIKDNLCTKGIRTTCFSRMLEKLVRPTNPTVTERLWQGRRGACWVKTHLETEFAHGQLDGTSAFGPQPQIPGPRAGARRQFRGGSAAAVAAGGSDGKPWGSDTAGSIRQPASLLEWSGLKPTYGRVSRWGFCGPSPVSLDQVAPSAPRRRLRQPAPR